MKNLKLTLREVENRNSPSLIGSEALASASVKLCKLCVDLSTSTCTSSESSCSSGGAQ